MPHVVFDFDGPIFDGRAAAEKALFQTTVAFREKYGERSLSFFSLPLLGPERMIATLYPELGTVDRETVRIFYEQRLNESERHQGLPASLRSQLDVLKGRGCRLAIYSARRLDNLQPLLQDLGLVGYFSDPTPGCMPKYKKPSGDYLRHVAEQFGVPPKELMFVGDSDVDYRAAKDAGVFYYHAGWTREPNAESAKYAAGILENFQNLISLLEDADKYRDVTADEAGLFNSVETGEFCFYGGAGISAPSQIGGWEDHYRPLLDRVSAGYLSTEPDLPEALQMLAVRAARSKNIFDEFRASFKRADRRPNPYHFAMLRSSADRIWTSNYDDLFEKAINDGQFDRRVAQDDADLLKDFGGRLVIKMNGDFESAQFGPDLDWGIVFLQEQFDRAERDREEIWRLFEDDYRQRSIIFAGVSFRDPVLRRIVAVARQKISRTKHNHYLIAKREKEPVARVKQVMFAENLQRASIYVIFKDTYEEIINLVRRIAMVSYRPIVGFSGNVGKITDKKKGSVPKGFTMPPTQVGEICEVLGRELARKHFRVTSGCAPFVGIPAVEAAFELNPACARFYLRKGGGTRFEGRAPAIVVPGSDYASMRRRFIPELSALIAIGGNAPAGEKSGTIEEVEMALDRGIPVILLPSAGGEIRSNYVQLRNRMETAYRDSDLRKLVAEINDEASKHTPESLRNFAREELPQRVQELLSALMGAAIALERSEQSHSW